MSICSKRTNSLRYNRRPCNSNTVTGPCLYLYILLYLLSVTNATILSQQRLQVNDIMYLGQPLTKTGTLSTTLGTLNPFRYRSYVYDEETGLSFTTTRPYMGDYSITTMEAVNATGYLIAVQDGPHHVSVLPVDISKMQEWIDSRPTALVKPHLLTQILSKISRKVR